MACISGCVVGVGPLLVYLEFIAASLVPDLALYMPLQVKTVGYGYKAPVALDQYYHLSHPTTMRCTAGLLPCMVQSLYTPCCCTYVLWQTFMHVMGCQLSC